MDIVLTSVETWLAVVRVEEAATSEVGPGLLAFTIVALLAVATFFLIRSMLHHLGKVPPNFDGPAEAPNADTSEIDSSDSGLNER